MSRQTDDATEREVVDILVVQTHPRKEEKQLAARGLGWPEQSEPAKLNQHFAEEMRRLKKKIDVQSIERETKVAEMNVRRSDHEITSVNILR
jgi:cobyrinic acid a,c-diamide synthase